MLKRLSSSFTSLSPLRASAEGIESLDVNAVQASKHAVTNWKIIKDTLGNISRGSLLEGIRDNLDNPDLHHVLRLGQILLDEGNCGTNGFKGRSSHILYCGALLIEWAKLNGAEVADSGNLALAQAHCEIWKGNSIAADPYNLQKSVELYEESISHHASSVMNHLLMTDYSKVLQYSGQIHKASNIFMSMLSMFEDRPEFPTYVFYAGGMLKALGDFDKAGSYLFEAMNIGPPRLFSRLDMMFVVARTLEESTADSDEPSEDGYRMVHHHLLSDGLLSDTVSYDSWINDANTWLSVADKCSIVGIFSLAADLYGQGINRDINAFKKTRIWLGFAKACARCGKNSEAQLALKQALALDAHNVQCKSALEQLANLSTGRFETLVNGSLSTILDLLPQQIPRKDLAASKLQAMLRGKRTRAELETGHSREDGGIRKRLKGSIGLLVKNTGEHERKQCSILLRFVSDWHNGIKDAQTLDVLTGEFSIVKLERPALAPSRVSGLSRSYSLQVVVATDDDIKVLLGNEIVSEDRLKEKRLLKISYIESSGLYYSQLFFVSLCANTEESLIKNLQLRRVARSVVTTDDHTYDIAKGCTSHAGLLYMYRIRNSSKTSRILLFQPKSNQHINLEFNREYFDLTVSVKHTLNSCFLFLDTYSRFNVLLQGEREPLPLSFSPAPAIEEQTTVPFNQPSFRDLLMKDEDKAVIEFAASINKRPIFVQPHIHNRGIDFVLRSADPATPLFSHSFESQDGRDGKPLPPVISLFEETIQTSSKKKNRNSSAASSPVTRHKSIVSSPTVEDEPVKVEEVVKPSSPNKKEEKSEQLDGVFPVVKIATIPVQRKPRRETVTPNLATSSGPVPLKTKDGPVVLNTKDAALGKSISPSSSKVLLAPVLQEDESVSSLGSNSIGYPVADSTSFITPSKPSIATVDPITAVDATTATVMPSVPFLVSSNDNVIPSAVCATPIDTPALQVIATTIAVSTSQSDGSALKKKDKKTPVKSVAPLPAAAALFLAPAATATPAIPSNTKSKSTKETKSPSKKSNKPLVDEGSDKLESTSIIGVVVAAAAVPSSPVAAVTLLTVEPTPSVELPPMAASVETKSVETVDGIATTATTTKDIALTVSPASPTSSTLKQNNIRTSPKLMTTSTPSFAFSSSPSQPSPIKQMRALTPSAAVDNLFKKMAEEKDDEENLLDTENVIPVVIATIRRQDFLDLAKPLIEKTVDLEAERIRQKQEEEQLIIFAEETKEEKEKLLIAKKGSIHLSSSIASNFMKLEQMRMEAMHYLAEVGHKSLIKVNRDLAYDFLTSAVKQASVKFKVAMNSLGAQRAQGSIYVPRDHQRIGQRKMSILPPRVGLVKGIKEDATSDITHKRNEQVARRRQSIIDNNISRHHFDVSRALQLEERKTHTDERRNRDESDCIEGTLAFPSTPSTPSTPSPRLVSPGDRSPVETGHEGLDTLSKTCNGLQYFRGHTMDPGFFPPQALETAEALVQALRDFDSQSHLHSLSALSPSRPSQPINSDVLKALQEKLTIPTKTTMKKLGFSSSTGHLPSGGSLSSSKLPARSFALDQLDMPLPSLTSTLYRKVAHIQAAEGTKMSRSLTQIEKSFDARTSAEALTTSLSKYHTLGYTTGDNTYRSHWTAKIDDFYLDCAQDVKALTKRMAALKKIADLGGHMTQSELFCALADSRGNLGEAVGRLANPEFLAEIRTICSVVPIEDYLSSLSLPSYDKKSEQNEFRISRSDSRILSAVTPGPDDLIRLRGGFEGNLSAFNPLPHMGLSSFDAVTVSKRGHLFNLSGSTKIYPLSPKSQQRIASRDGLLSRSRSRSRSPLAKGSLTSSLMTEEAPSSVHIGKTISRKLEEQLQPTVVMSRHDALRALQDEILSHSPERHRLSRGGLDHGKEKRRKARIKAAVHDWVDYSYHQFKEYPEYLEHHSNIFNHQSSSFQNGCVDDDPASEVSGSSRHFAYSTRPLATVALENERHKSSFGPHHNNHDHYEYAPGRNTGFAGF